MFGPLPGTHTIAQKQILPMTGFVGQNLGTGNFVDRKAAPACVRDNVWILLLFQNITHQTFEAEQISPLI